jgi:hypothetical protein
MATVAPARVLRGFGRAARGHWAGLGSGVITAKLMYTALGRSFGLVLQVRRNAGGGVR